jgi:hypothetical protein
VTARVGPMWDLVAAGWPGPAELLAFLESDPPPPWRRPPPSKQGSRPAIQDARFAARAGRWRALVWTWPPKGFP